MSFTCVFFLVKVIHRNPLTYPQVLPSYPQAESIVYKVSVLSYPQKSVLSTTTERELLFWELFPSVGDSYFV